MGVKEILFRSRVFAGPTFPNSSRKSIIHKNYPERHVFARFCGSKDDEVVVDRRKNRAQ